MWAAAARVKERSITVDTGQTYASVGVLTQIDAYRPTAQLTTQ